MRLKFKSLLFKIGLFTLLVLSIILLFFSIVFVVFEKQRLSEEMIQNGITFANFSKNTIYNNYVQYYTHPQPEDFIVFKENLQTILSENKNVEEVTLFGTNGRLLFTTNELETGKYRGVIRRTEDDWIIQAIAKREISYREIRVDDQKQTQIVVPVYQGTSHFFSFAYFLSHSSLNDRMKEIYLQIFYVVFLSLVFAIISIILFTSKFVKPIKSLTLAANQIRQGNFNVKVDIGLSEDELSNLSIAFNKMVEEVDKSYKVLEKKVEERTTALENERKSLDKKVAERTSELEKLKNELEIIVEERTRDLKEKLLEIERINKHMIGREVKMAELKEKIKKLENSTS